MISNSIQTRRQRSEPSPRFVPHRRFWLCANRRNADRYARLARATSTTVRSNLFPPFFSRRRFLSPYFFSSSPAWPVRSIIF